MGSHPGADIPQLCLAAQTPPEQGDASQLSLGNCSWSGLSLEGRAGLIYSTAGCAGPKPC